MSIYDKASLVLIPSGTKTSKVYSQKPVNGNGDFTFSRSTAATRVNADGNIEKETQNLLLQSNNFDTTWALTTASVTSGQSGYDGSSDAWLLTKSGASGRLFQNLSASGVLTFSVYMKANASTWGLIQVDGSPNDAYAYVDLSNGSFGSTSSYNITESIENVGNDWYRVSISLNDTATRVRIYPAETNSASATSGSIYIQDAQLEQGMVARDYIETTTAAVEGGITDNVPRLDYTDSSCPALLLEPQRTNGILQSEYFNSWTKVNVNITDNNTTSPEGLNNAAKITPDTTNSFHYLDTASVNINSNGTASVYAKADGYNKIALRSYFDGRYAIFNLNDGTLGNYTAASASIEDAGNGWYRCSLNENSTSSYGAQVFVMEDGSTNPTAVYQGDNIKSVYLYGFQVEPSASYATSYIPTYGTSVTRGKDDCTIADTGDIIADSKGSFFIDLDVDFLDNNGLIPITAGSGTAALYYLWLTTGGTIRSEWYNGGGLQAAIATSGGYFNIGDRLKIAAGYQDNDFVMYVNGTLIGTDTSGNAPSPTLLRIGKYNVDNYTGGAINQFLAFPTRLSNEELAALTTI